MKRIVFVALTFFAVLGLSVTAGHAGPPPAFEPCDPDYRMILEHQADAIRVRNRAYAAEIITRNESTLKLTCFDQAMRLSTRLGYVFSDKILRSPPVYNVIVFGLTTLSGLAYSGWGSQQLLAKRLDVVMNDPVPNPPLGMYDEWLTNFPPDNIIPRPFPLNALATLVAPGSVIQNAIKGIIDFQYNVDRISAAQVGVYTQQINELIEGIPKVAASSLGAYIGDIQNRIQLRQALINQIDVARQSTMDPFLDTLASTILGPATDMDCTRMDDYWADGNPASNFAPPAPVTCGAPTCQSVCVSDTTMCCVWNPAPACPPSVNVAPKDYFGGTPYYKLEDLFNRVVPGASMVFLEQITPTVPPAPPSMNSVILDQARDDLMVLQRPGLGPAPDWFWPDTPGIVFNPQATVRQIVDAMDVP